MGFFAEMDYEDLLFAAQAKPSRPRMVCSYAQQCIEKYLKHIAQLNGAVSSEPVIQSHNLVRIAMAAKYPDVDKYRTELLSLGKIYFEGRYPEYEKGYMFVMPTPSEALQAAELALIVREWALTAVQDDAKYTWNSISSLDLK